MRALLLGGAALALGACAVIQQVGIPTPGAVANTADAISKCDEAAAAPVPVTEEYALGGSLAVNFVGQTGLWVDPADPKSAKNRLAIYLNIVGRNLAAQSDRPTLDWTFGILDQADPNAFSTPGGYVFVSKGLLKQLSNEAQLAGILGHEIGHVTLRHAIKQYQGVKATVCKKDAVGNAVFGPMSIAGINLDDVKNALALGKFTDQLATDLHNAGYGKDDEFEADRVGAELALTAGYNPHELASYLRQLPAGSALFSHHPPPADREKALETWISDYCSKKESLVAEADCPFTSYPKVEFPADVKSAISQL